MPSFTFELDTYVRTGTHTHTHSELNRGQKSGYGYYCHGNQLMASIKQHLSFSLSLGCSGNRTKVKVLPCWTGSKLSLPPLTHAQRQRHTLRTMLKFPWTHAHLFACTHTQIDSKCVVRHTNKCICITHTHTSPRSQVLL